MGTLSRIGILTGGGDCPGLNAVIRAVAKMALTHLDVEVIGFLDGFEGLVDNRFIRTLEAYEKIINGQTTVVVPADSELMNVLTKGAGK